MATPNSMTGLRGLLSRGPEMGLAALVLIILASLVLPIPPAFLDVLLAFSIVLSVIVLLTTIYTTNPLDFNSFPGILLLLTLFRLGLNTASTKLILGDGDAGNIIEAFGGFVVRGNVAVGMLVFLILVIVNFVVITKGSGRVAEVAARFTLDAMPAKQMSIDGDLQAGLIDENEARKRRTEIEQQADFYGSMDGAAKFVRGDAIAGLIITAINLLGGLYVGVVQRGMGLGEAVDLYSRLTIGDGLVSQIPALIVSTAAGIIVTQAAGATHMGEAVFSQLTKHARALWVSAGVVFLFALIPGLPFFPFMLLGVMVSALARAAGKKAMAEEAMEEVRSAARSEREPAGGAVESDQNRVQEILQVDPLEVQLGYSLLDLADPRAGGDLLDRVTAMRKATAIDIGMLIPPVRIRDNENLSPNTYAIKIRGVTVAEGEIFPKALLAINAGDVLEEIDGFRKVRDPSYGLPALWVRSDQKVDSETAGYLVVQPATVLATHLQETIRQNAADLLGRQEVQELIDGLKRTHPALVQDVVAPDKVSLGTLQRVLQRLLREGVPIRDMVTILETLSDAADQQIRDADALTEQVRRALAKVIAHLHEREDGAVYGIMVGPRLEAALMRTFSPGQDARGEILSAEQLRGLLDELETMVGRHRHEGRNPPLIAPPSLRVAIRRMLEPVIPSLPVISVAELPPTVPIHAVATWNLGAAT